MDSLHYRDAHIDDLPQIVAIYNSTVSSRIVTADTDEVSVESKLQWFHDHNPVSRPLWMIYQPSGELVGWASFQSFYGRPAYNETAEISLYLAPAMRGKGFGSSILTHCINTAPQHGIKTLLGYIFAHNDASIKLFEKLGFEQWGHLPDVAVLDGIQRSLKILGRKTT